jgi:hypothetical protein
MNRIILIHGTEGSPNENWFPWLKTSLEKKGHKCIVPQFPTPDGQCLDSWLEVIDQEVGVLHTSDMLVGHSTGVIFSLNVLNRISHQIKSTALSYTRGAQAKKYLLSI